MLRAMTLATFAAALIGPWIPPATAQVVSTVTSPELNFEAGASRQLLLSPDGATLYLLHTRDQRLEVFGVRHAGGGASQALRPIRLVPEASIFTGLEPVSMALDPNDANVMFVANMLSDSVAVVNLAERRIVTTIPVGDEPRDLEVVNGKLYVACARAPRIGNPDEFRDHALVVCDATAPYARQKVINLQGHRPCSLSTDGTYVYAIPRNSGNHTTILKDDLAQSLGITQLTVDAFDTNFILNEVLLHNFPGFAERGWEIPQAGRIVFDWEWPSDVQQLADRDVIAVDTNTDSKVASVSTGVGTTLFNIERNPLTGDLWVANTDANNRIRMEYNLQGNAVRNLVTIVDGTPGGLVQQQIELAPPLTTRMHAQPHSIAFHIGTGVQYAYVTALGSASVVILDAATAAFVGELDVGPIPGGLAVDSVNERLFVYTRGDKSIQVFDIANNHAPLSTRTPVTYDPELPVTVQGRNSLYEARSSSGHGNGNMSCATCHVFGDTDGLAWDLGNSQGGLSYMFPDTLGQPGGGFENDVVAALTTPVQSPMKGPLTTQTLRDLPGTEPFHWRGDRRFLHNFRGAFEGLNGGTGISEEDMQKFTSFVRSIDFPPNPLQAKDRQYTGSELDGLVTFGMPPHAGKPYVTGGGAFRCVTCHTADLIGLTDFTGTQPFLNEELIFQLFNPNQMRGLYDKEHMELTGFGTHHDGVFDGVFGFLDADFLGFEAFDLLSTQDKNDLRDMVNAWDSGLAPLVGDQFHLDLASVVGAGAFLDLVEAQSELSPAWLDVIAKGWKLRMNGRKAPIGLVYQFDSVAGQWRYRRDNGAWLDRTTMLAWVNAGVAEFTFTAVPPGTGVRLGIDRDEDGVFDRVETWLNTRPDDPDSDQDGYDDLADLSLGGNPAVFDALLPDVTAPSVDSHAALDVFITTATLVVQTDEPTTLSVVVTPSGSPALPPRVSDELRRTHQIVLADLEAGVLHQYDITASDRNGNTGLATGNLTTVVPHLHIESMSLDTILPNPTILEARFRVVDQSGNPVAGVPVNGRLAGDIGGNSRSFTVLTDGNGEAVHQLNAYVPAGADTVTVGVDFLGSLEPPHPYFVGAGGGTSAFFYEQAANVVNYATEDVQ